MRTKCATLTEMECWFCGIVKTPEGYQAYLALYEVETGQELARELVAKPQPRVDLAKRDANIALIVRNFGADEAERLVELGEWRTAIRAGLERIARNGNVLRPRAAGWSK